MSLLKNGDYIGIVACSNGQPLSNNAKIENLLLQLESLDLTPICSKYIYEINSPFNGSAEAKGEIFMDLYKNDKIKAIFDISGGDLANEVLDYLDYKYIAETPKPFFGYSDLTTVLNAIYSQTNNPVYLYQIRNLIYSDSESQKANFINSLFNGKEDLFNFSYKFIQGRKIEGTVVGGNIRCLLKLAGTKYMPDLTDKVLFLESMGGEAGLMSSFLNQLKQMGAFDKIKGLILGTFSKMQENNISPTIEELAVKIINNPNLPIAKTEEIGHGVNSKCIIIGKNIILK
ncbi:MULTISPECIES: S66 peptidase family protein [unclassified Clostridium]|uniref:S66 family peptidase n=1 Tax=unclassified Clostridium TaxID=2614128 RepID=UPI001C8B1CA5|nr:MULTISPECIES: S66 peptidase family protein [unclassified Clostridium]MBX9137954.1 LD-carboxypeptidase [Clostridium sp. K12(2020)]MBX9144727.1 LD-carboxypeptidase [Clostridium sp. K13]MDU4327370.1 LD-carboxypeptidase [Clostridium celatum]